MFKIVFSLLLGISIVAVNAEPAAAGKRGLLGAAIGAGAAILIINELSKKKRKSRRYRSRSRHTRSRQAVNPAAALEPKMNRQTKQAIQMSLNQRGFNVGFADGDFGRNTRKGVKNFQTSINQPGTGYLTQGQVAILLGGAATPNNFTARALTVATAPVALLPNTLQEQNYITNQSQAYSNDPTGYQPAAGYNPAPGFVQSPQSLPIPLNNQHAALPQLPQLPGSQNVALGGDGSFNLSQAQTSVVQETVVTRSIPVFTPQSQWEDVPQ